MIGTDVESVGRGRLIPLDLSARDNKTNNLGHCTGLNFMVNVVWIETGRPFST